jgi:hypothetical protein
VCVLALREAAPAAFHHAHGTVRLLASSVALLAVPECMALHVVSLSVVCPGFAFPKASVSRLPHVSESAQHSGIVHTAALSGMVMIDI